MAAMGRRVGVIGVGFGVAVHIPAYRAEGFEITAICARTPEKVNQAAMDLEIPNVFTDYHDLIARHCRSRHTTHISYRTHPGSHCRR